MDIPDLVMKLMMDRNNSFRIKHECVMVSIALLFEGNKKAQAKYKEFVMSNGNEELFIFLKEQLSDTFDRLFNRIIEETNDSKLKKEFSQDQQGDDDEEDEEEEDAQAMLVRMATMRANEPQEAVMRPLQCDDTTWLR
jgi:hypothetical protein